MNIIKSLTSLLLFLCYNIALAQLEASNWYFGENAGITFNISTGAVSKQNDGMLNTREGCATISDETGNLLFYTDGTTVWDKNHDVMSNGFGLYGDSSSTQSAIIIPKPNNPLIYYIFTVDNALDGFNFGLNYSEVDMSFNAGLGAVTSKNVNLLNLCSEKLTAVLKDCLTDSLWVIAFASKDGRAEGFDTYHAFEVTNLGINMTSVKSTFDISIFDARGYLKLSPAGSKVASANSTGGLFIYDFDTQTGQLSNQLSLVIASNNDAGRPYGVEFSPNGEILYVNSSNDFFDRTNQGLANDPSYHFSNLSQFDLTATDIQSSQIILDERNLYRGALQLGPNGKIYRALSATYNLGLPNLGVINNPNILGLGSNYQHNAIDLSPNLSTQGLPPFLASFFNTEIDIIKNGESSISLNLCEGDTYTLISDDIPNATYVWTKDDIPLVENTFELEISESGYYQVYIEPNNGDCAIEGQAFVTFNENPEAYNSILYQCDEDGSRDGITVFNLSEAIESLTGGIDRLSTKFYSDASLLNEIDPDSYKNVSNPQIVYVEVINEDTSCKNYSELTLQVSITDANDVIFDSVCDDDGIEDGLYVFNLDNVEDEILDGLPSGLSVSYYETYEDALLENNELTINYQSTVPYRQTIYARVEDNNICFGISTIELMVNRLPELETEDLVYYCLNQFPETININAGLLIGNQSDYTYEWTTEEDSYDISINSTGTYRVTVYNSDGCSKTRTVIVEPSNVASINSIEVTDATQNNIVEVLVSGEGIYEFALYNTNNTSQYRSYQSGNTFENVYPGIYTVRVRDLKNDCGVINDRVSVIGFPKFFTPNNDGRHDTWQVLGVSEAFQPGSKILIFDRYGKLIKQLDPKGRGWDGFFNGALMPSDDYWFAVTLQDGRIFKNHFSLVR